MTTHELPVSEPWFSLIKLGHKTREGRINKTKSASINIGDLVLFTNNELGVFRKFTVEIKNIVYYDDFQSYLENETLEKCLPCIDTIEDGLKVYYKYYTKYEEYEYGIKAFIF